MKKAKVHEELGSTAWDAFRRLVGQLLSNICLFLEVYAAEWVIFEAGKGALDMVWEDIQLVLTRQAEAQCPEFRFNLASLASRVEFWVVAACDCVVA
jgi:hypothetical protein